MHQIRWSAPTWDREANIGAAVSRPASRMRRTWGSTTMSPSRESDPGSGRPAAISRKRSRLRRKSTRPSTSSGIQRGACRVYQVTSPTSGSSSSSAAIWAPEFAAPTTATERPANGAGPG